MLNRNIAATQVDTTTKMKGPIARSHVPRGRKTNIQVSELIVILVVVPVVNPAVVPMMIEFWDCGCAGYLGT